MDEVTAPGAGAGPPARSSEAGVRDGQPGEGRRLLSRHAWLPALAALAVLAPPFWGLWRGQGAPMEEGFMLVFPEMVLEGKVPNRDFLHLYGPGSLWVLAAAYAVFGVRLAVERAVGVLQHLGLALGIYGLVLPWGPWVAAGGAGLAIVIVVTSSGFTAMAWVGGIAIGVWALRAAVEAMEAAPDSRRGQRQALLAGVLAGAALLYRLDLVLAVALAGLVVAPALGRSARRRALVGLAVGLAPYLVHLALAGVGNVVEGMLLEPVFDLRGGRKLPLPHSFGHDYDGFLQGSATFNLLPWPLPRPRGPVQLGLWPFLLGAADLALLVAGIRRWRRDGDRRLLAMALFAIGLVPQALQRPDSTHLAWVSCVSFGLLPAAMVELARSWLSTPGKRAILAVGVPAAVTLLVIPDNTWRAYADSTVQSFGYRREEQVIRHAGRSFPYRRSDAVAAIREMLPVVDKVTEPGDKLIVGPGDLRKTPYSEAFLYYLLPDLEPATRYVEMDPGIANADNSGLADEIREADVVILSSIRDDWDEPNDSRRFGSDEPNQVLARHFCMVGSFGDGLFGRGLYELYIRC